MIKVVNANLVSYSAPVRMATHTTKPEYCVTYKVGKYSKAPLWLSSLGYHLTVFNQLHNALDFIRNDHRRPHLRLFVVDCLNEIRPLPPRLPFRTLFPWKVYQWKYSYGHVWPAGTRMFEKVKLLEELDV